MSLAGAGRIALYNPSNAEYGSAWFLDGRRGELGLNAQGTKLPPYSEVVQAMSDFRRAEKLIKNSMVASKYSEGGPTKAPSASKEFPYKGIQSSEVRPGIRVGPPIYTTSNMSYGSLRPTDFEMPKEYHPSNNQFTKRFNGGNFKYSGLNTTKTLSRVHQRLDEL
jgi:hypothetical protein